MTQAFNLSQFANFLNTSGQISLSGSGITRNLPVANGGTGTATPSLVGGTNITISGSFPNQTVSFNGSAGLSGFSTVIFTANGTWTVPSGVTQARVTVIGGGGAAYGASYSGGGGGICVAYLTGLSGSYTITVGAGKDDGAGAGGSSSFGTLVTATGGGGATGSAHGSGGSGSTTGTKLRSGYVAYSGGSWTGIKPSFLDAGVAGMGSNSNFATTWTLTTQQPPGMNGIGSASSKGSYSGVVMIEY